MTKRPTIRLAGKTAEVLIYEDIGEWFGGITAKSFADELKQLPKVDAIDLRINSNGGVVFDGVAIYTTLMRHPARVNVSVDGAALSIASVIAMAGETITMADGAFMMIHDPWSGVFGTAAEMRHEADVLDKIRDETVGIYAKRTGMEADRIEQMMGEETWMNATEAAEFGFADTVTEQMAVAAHINPRIVRSMPQRIKTAMDAQRDREAVRARELQSTLDQMLPNGQ